MRVNGGGHVSQIYAIRQAISKALVAYYQKCKYYLTASYCFGCKLSFISNTKIVNLL